jgi:hypothetical protein
MSDVARENQGIMNSLLRAELLGHSLLYTPKSFEPMESGDFAALGGRGRSVPSQPRGRPPLTSSSQPDQVLLGWSDCRRKGRWRGIA